MQTSVADDIAIVLVLINTLLDCICRDLRTFSTEVLRHFNDLRTFVANFLLLRFTHFFRRFFETEKQNPQTFILLECMCPTLLCVPHTEIHLAKF